MSCRIEMDKECIELVNLLNTLYGIKTTESCCGHFKEPYAIYFDCTEFSALGRLYRCIDRNYSDGKFVIEVCCSDTNPVYGFVLKSKKPFNNDEEMNESLNLLIENINYWFKDAFDEYFMKNMMNKKDDKSLTENNRLLATDDFDFDGEIEKSQKEQIEKKNKPDIKVTVSSKDKTFNELDGMNPKDDPSFFFDFRQLLKPFDFQFIKENQNVFWDDCHFFSMISEQIIYNDANFVLWIPVENHMHQNNIFRVYIERRNDRLLIPVIVSENTKFRNLKEYNLSEDTTNELCCYLSLMNEHLRDICTGKTRKYMYRLYNLIPLNRLVSTKTLLEAFCLKPEDSGCTRCIWIDENRNTTHGPRIKVQHNLQYKSTKQWATLTINGEFHHDSNPDNRFKTVDRELLQAFVKYNKDLISYLFYSSKISDVDILNRFVKIDMSGKPVIKKKVSDIDKNDLCDFESILNNLTICRRKKDKLMNVIINDEKFLFDRWFDSIKYNKRLFRLDLKSDNWTKEEYYYFKTEEDGR